MKCLHLCEDAISNPMFVRHLKIPNGATVPIADKEAELKTVARTQRFGDFLTGVPGGSHDCNHVLLLGMKI
jgi:hypothetical protein